MPLSQTEVFGLICSPCFQLIFGSVSNGRSHRARVIFSIVHDHRSTTLFLMMRNYFDYPPNPRLELSELKNFSEGWLEAGRNRIVLDFLRGSKSCSPLSKEEFDIFLPPQLLSKFNFQFHLCFSCSVSQSDRCCSSVLNYQLTLPLSALGDMHLRHSR